MKKRKITTTKITLPLRKHPRLLGESKITQDPYDIATWNSEIVTLFDKAVQLHDENKLFEAIGEYRNALQIDPRNICIWSNMGSAYLAHGGDDGGVALDCFTEVIKLDPSDAFAHANCAHVYFMRAQWKEALEHYNKALEFCDAVSKPNLLKDRATVYIKLAREDFIKFRRLLQAY
jgi:tetratricopeptide (TPR) repeat protein